MSEEDLTKLLVRVDIPDIKNQKCVVLSLKDTVWVVKQVVLDKLNQELPNNLLNYGLYLLPSVPGKLGKYMDDGRCLGDYVLHGHVPRIEMRYKRRDYSIQVSLKGKDISKANSKANLRKFVENVVQGNNVKKVEKMLDSGVDPNFITEDGNTPLGLACGRNSNVQVIMPLLSNGAHIDFRGKDGLTPLHRAALGGNSAAIKILLSYGASPNYRDVKGLTPLYHTAIMGDDTACCESLLRYRAELGIKDHGGWTELHQVTKYGHENHADLLIKYGADIHSQNNAGNTPFHVAASHGQRRLAMLLLTRGADRTRINFSNQLPFQVAILCGHHDLAAEINSFRQDQVVPITEPPDYHPGARHFDRNLFDMDKMRSEVGPSVPPPDTVVDSLAQEWGGDRDYPEVAAAAEREDFVGEGGGGRGRGGVGGGGGGELMWSKSAAGSSLSIPSMTAGYSLQPHHSIETADSESISSYDRDSIHSTSTTGGTPGPNTPQTYHRRQPTFATQRERLYRAGPGRYVVTEDVDPQQSDDIPLRRGMEAEVVYIGKGGYWEGKSGGRQGWFPARAIQEVTDDGDSGVFSEYSSRSNQPMSSLPAGHQLLPTPPPMQQPDWSIPGSGAIRREVEEVGPARTARVPCTERFNSNQGGIPPHQQQQQQQYTGVREVFMKCGPKGYGFAMRGVKATKAMKFTPTPQVPALQYIGSVENGSAADLAGLGTGDFLLEINHQNVTYCTHDDVVSIIRQGGKSLQLKVVAPNLDPATRTSVQLQQQVEIINTTNSLDRHTYRRQQEEQPVRAEVPVPSSLAHTSHAMPQRETVIDEVPLRQPTRGEESPNLERINQSGWDSSQDEANHTPGTPNRVQKFSYLHPTPIVASTPPLTHKYSTGKHTAAASLSSNQSSSTSLSSMNEPNHLSASESSASKTATLPPQRGYPAGFGSSPTSSDNDEESEFTKALKKGKDKLVNSPAIRKRSSTLPSNARKHIQRGHPASRESHTPDTRKKSAESPEKNTAPIFREPLAAALIRKIDSVRFDSDRAKSSDEEDSFSQTPPTKLKSHSQPPVVQKEKVAPPAPKPKPQMQRANTVDPRLLDTNTGRQQTWNSSSSTDIIRSTQPTKNDDDESTSDGDGSGGRMDWKSVLRPVKRTDSGRASPGPPEVHRSRSNSNNSLPQQSPRRGSLKKHIDHVVNDFTQFDVDSNQLPPPLPVNAINNRLSMDFLHLPPPDDFMSLVGAETGETSTDHLVGPPPLPPPSHYNMGGHSPSPPPPPPPDSSPPREPLDHSQLAGVRFPPLTKKSAALPPPITEEEGHFKVPSPIPSPKNPSSFDTGTESETTILPPHEFTHRNEEQGFEIPMPPGFEIPTPPTQEEAVKRKGSPDLDQAIRELQLLSEDLTAAPAQSPVEQDQVEQKVDESVRQTDTVTHPHGTSKPTTTADSPVFTPPPRSRSSTSSSNVSSLTRDPEAETQPTSLASHHIKPLVEWEAEEVCQWLEEIGLGEHCPQFRENEILGEHILELTKEELAELGVKKIGHKKTFFTKVKELKS